MIRRIICTGILAFTSASLLAASTDCRVMTMNISPKKYKDKTGKRVITKMDPVGILKGIKPDVLLIQDFLYGDNSTVDIKTFVESSFGKGFHYTREQKSYLPNGIVSRWPIVESGQWVNNHDKKRNYVWAKIDIPGKRDLWAVSVHLLFKPEEVRNAEAQDIIRYVDAQIPNDDYLIIGGDLNTKKITESVITTFASRVAASAIAADCKGNSNTNGNRKRKPDWLMASPNLSAKQIPVKIGGLMYKNGLVFDSQVFPDLMLVAPINKDDCSTYNMKHSPIIKDFVITH